MDSIYSRVSLRRSLAAALAAVAIVLIAIPVLAHHSFDAEFDRTKSVTLQGTVVQFEFINPHSWIHLDVKDASGKVERWRAETGNPGSLLRRGWKKDSLKAGDVIVIEGFRAKNGSPTANAVSVKFADGRTVFAGSSSGAGN